MSANLWRGEFRFLHGLDSWVDSEWQIKSAYKRKALENHPDRFPPHVKLEAEARFKHVLVLNLESSQVGFN